jgi:hypothetical protein
VSAEQGHRASGTERSCRNVLGVDAQFVASDSCSSAEGISDARGANSAAPVVVIVGG